MAHRIRDWSELTDQPWDSIVLGNGFSIGINDRFRYDRLGQVEMDRRLAAVLDGCGTHDFEVGLLSLEHALRVHDALVTSVSGESRSAVHLAVEVLGVNRLRDKLRQALIDAVRANHPEPSELPRGRRRRIHRELSTYRSVFTTTYDLLVYWCLMAGDPKPVDGFSRRETGQETLSFVPRSRSEELPSIQGRPHLYYLHGALHLRECDDGSGAEKVVTADDAGSLLRTIERSWDQPGGQPLFVSEGSSLLKQQRIERSEYLRFATRELATPGRRVVVYGASIAEQDAHIWATIGDHAAAIAVGVHDEPRTAASPDAVEQMNRARQHFRTDAIEFFWTGTHPLFRASQADRPPADEQD